MAKRPTTKAAGSTPAAASPAAPPATAAQAAAQAEADRIAAEQAEADRIAAEQAAAQVEADRLAAELAGGDPLDLDAEDRLAFGLSDPDAAELGGFDMAGRTIFVRSVSPLGRRRAGRAFGPVPVPVAIDDLTEDQLAAILADTDHLVITLDS